jgi:uncharacterized protein YkwD
MYTSIISCVALLLSLSSFSLAGEAGTTVTLAPSLPTDAPSYVDNAKFRSAILNSTNFFRKQHGASPLKWNESLENFGDDHSEDCKFEHSVCTPLLCSLGNRTPNKEELELTSVTQGGPDGENLAEGYANVTSSVDAWGNERDKYDFNDQGFNHDTGHFTQLVWKASQTVGCGRKWCDDKFTGWYLVCEY